MSTRLSSLLFVALVGFTSVHAQQQFRVQPDASIYLDRAEAGDPEAQFQLGLRLVTPQDATDANIKQGAMWVKKAAEQDYLPAMHVLGEFYESGVGVPKDDKRAAEWQQKAADKGMPEAQLALALLMDQGKGTERNAEKAAELALTAARQSFGKQSVAQTFYAQKLVTGNGVKKNSGKAATWFLKAAQQGHPFAQRQLAYLYYKGEGVPVDYSRCQAWYEQAARGDEGDPWAKNDLAWFLATCPEKKFLDGSKAVAVAKQAIMGLQNLEGEQRHEMVDTMAAALARNGQYSEAIIWQKRCISLLAADKEAEAEERTKLEKEFNERLSLYKAQQPYADPAAAPQATPAEPLFNDDVLEQQSKQRQAPVPVPVPERRPSAPKKDKVI
jgi:TPR repeat protein